MNAESLAKLAVTRGAILHGPFDGVDHSKFFVIIGENEDHFVGFFFINSDIHRSIESKPEQFAMQMQIKRRDYDFLRYDKEKRNQSCIKSKITP